MDDLSDPERALVAVLQRGLPLVSHPYKEIGARVGLTERQVIDCLSRWQADGMIRRLGVVVRHHELGYQANAMVVWDVPDEQVREVGRRLGEQQVVTLCYRRPRRLPDWPYNLFCMIHGQDRELVLQHLQSLIARCGLEDIIHEVLFSCRRFKQQGARCIEADRNDPLQVAKSLAIPGQA